MKNLAFLNELLKERKIELIEPSEEISRAYEIKSDNCLRVAELAYNEEIYENAISEAYYSVYNSVLSLFFKCGIKCENHSGAIILIKELFLLEELYSVFSDFKKDRIDNQYYVSTIKTKKLEKENCLQRINQAKEFNVKIKTYKNNLRIGDIQEIRKKFEELKEKENKR